MRTAHCPAPSPFEVRTRRGAAPLLNTHTAQGFPCPTTTLVQVLLRPQVLCAGLVGCQMRPIIPPMFPTPAL